MSEPMTQEALDAQLADIRGRLDQDYYHAGNLDSQRLRMKLDIKILLAIVAEVIDTEPVAEGTAPHD